MSDKLISCPVCLCPGYPVRAVNDGALFVHPNRMFPCRVADPTKIQEYRNLALAYES